MRSATDVPWQTAPDFCERILDNLPVPLDDEAAAYARELAQRYSGEFSAKPSTVAASAVYFAAKYHSRFITQELAGDPVGVTPATISRTYPKLAEAEGIEIKHRATVGEEFVESKSLLSRLLKAIKVESWAL